MLHRFKNFLNKEQKELFTFKSSRRKNMFTEKKNELNAETQLHSTNMSFQVS